jgi:hypothetical protein
MPRPDQGKGESARIRRTRRILHAVFPLLLAVLLTSVAFFTTAGHRQNRGFDTDGRIYAAMAGSPLFDPALARQAPYAYRILTPYLASLLPWPTLESFRFLAYVSNVLSLFLLFRILRRFEFAADLCVVGVLLYAGVFWTLKFSFFSPAYVDYLTQMLLLLIVLLTLSGHYLFLALVLALAPLQKESLAVYGLFVAAHVLTHLQGRVRSVVLAISVIGLPLATVVAVRLLVITAHNSHDPFEVLLNELSKLADPRIWPIWLQATFSGLGLLPLILSARSGDWLGFLKTHAEWTVYLLISAVLLFGGEDKARLFLYSLPLSVLLAVHVLQGLKESQRPRCFYLWMLVAVSLHLFLGGYLTPMGSFDEYLARMVPEHSRGHYRPFLIRNCVLALTFMLFTLWIVGSEWTLFPARRPSRRRAGASGPSGR